jgi:structural maintenance of chromosomes flexible hinge domain-containing protein 1
MPKITVQAIEEQKVVWSVDLHEVTDDLESRYLAAKGDEMQFTIEVPGKGHVDGVLW